MLTFIVKSFPYVSFPNSGHLLSFFWHDYNKNMAQTYCQPPPRHCGGTVSASEAISPPDWTSYIESIVENVVFKELVILNRTCLFYWALYLKPVLTLVNILNEMTSQPVGRKYLWLLTVQKKELHIVGRRRNPSTDGICAGEDPCNVCLMLHNKRAPSIGRDPRFPLTIRISGVYPTLRKQLFYHPPYCCTPGEAHKPSSPSLPYWATSSSPLIIFTVLRWAHSCSSPPFQDQRKYSMCGEWGVLRWWGINTSPDIWIPCNRCIRQVPSQSLSSKNCMNCSAWQIFFFAKPGEKYMLKQKYMHLGLNAFDQLLKPRNV